MSALEQCDERACADVADLVGQNVRLAACRSNFTPQLMRLLDTLHVSGLNAELMVTLAVRVPGRVPGGGCIVTLSDSVQVLVHD